MFYKEVQEDMSQEQKEDGDLNNKLKKKQTMRNTKIIEPSSSCSSSEPGETSKKDDKIIF